ncbi:MAG: hypothetical protein K8S99_04010 [Planctomycetes bacterium]|nr:hypothetical protein [Planctomycetota bacterium]
MTTIIVFAPAGVWDGKEKTPVRRRIGVRVSIHVVWSYIEPVAAVCRVNQKYAK